MEVSRVLHTIQSTTMCVEDQHIEVPSYMIELPNISGTHCVVSPVDLRGIKAVLANKTTTSNTPLLGDTFTRLVVVKIPPLSPLPCHM